MTDDLKTLLVHLRLPFQLLLAPVFLWGWLVAGGGLSVAVLLGFVCLHVFLYSGATAFNSYYDRDEGPVGGLEHPPEVSPVLLPFSLAVQAFGWLLAFFVNLPFWLAYGAFAALSFAYSHPRVRLKAHTLASLVVVGLGQGALAFVAAWAATRGEIGSAWSVDGALGAASSVLLILALYPLTQLYQIDEDATRGDRTVVVAWGPRRSFVLALACTVAGGGLMLTLLARRFGAVDAVVVGLGLAAQVSGLAWWGHRFDVAQVRANYHRVMRLNVLNAAALGGYLVVRLSV
ncbi:MAG: UbiA family prenyltransferase [Chloroflexota bacterium]|nr:UbiA family prenyltransferase [Chloroflexota bacterium]